MPGNKCFLALSAGMKCLQVPCPNLGMCHDLLLAQGEMRHLASVTWLVSSGVGSDRGSLPVGIVLWPLLAVQGIRIQAYVLRAPCTPGLGV